MLKETGRQIPQSGADEIDPAMNAPRVLGEIRGAADGDSALAAMTPGELHCAAIFDAEIEKFSSSAPGAHRRVAKVMQNAQHRNRCQCEQGWTMLAQHLQTFARAAEECIERFDDAGLGRAITALVSAATTAESMTPPRPALMPGVESFRHYGWSGEEISGLQTILTMSMCGVERGDFVKDLDEEGVTLKSGKRLSRDQIIAANRPAWMGPMVRPATERMPRS